MTVVRFAASLKKALNGTASLVLAELGHYPDGVTGEPPIFLIFDEGLLSAGYRLEPQRSPSGDDCHYNIHGVSNAHYKKPLKSKRLSDFLICDNGGQRQLTRADLP
jgi:hypothetical protein